MRTRHRAAAALALLAFAPLAAPARAQAPAADAGLVRRGVYLAAGVNYGTHSIDCSGCVDSWLDGASGSLTVGWTLGGRHVLGLEASYGAYGRSREQGFAAIGPALLLYPARTGVATNLFLRAVPQLLVVGDRGEPGIGGALGVAVGYDVPLGRSLALTPSVSYRIGHPGGATSQLVQAGVALTLP